VLSDRGATKEAEELLLECAAIREKALGAMYSPGCIFDLAGVLQKQGRDAEAEALFRRALEVRSSRFAKGDPDISPGALALTAGGLATLLAARGCMEEAEVHMQRAFDLSQLADARSYSHGGRALRLGVLRFEQGRFEEAEVAGRWVLDVYDRFVDAHDVRNARPAELIGSALREQGRLEEADAFATRSVALVEGAQPFDASELLKPLTGLGLLRLRQGRLAEAEVILVRASSLDEKRGVNDRRLRARSLAALSAVLREAGRFEEALAQCRQSLEIREATLAIDARELLEARQACAQLEESLDSAGRRVHERGRE
jgi:tetratricopeptide (TPR) repeat protein